jgi:hypothetical protein
MLHMMLFSFGFISIPRGTNNLLIDVEIAGESGLSYAENFPSEPGEQKIFPEMTPDTASETPSPSQDPTPDPTPPEDVPLQDVMPADDPQQEAPSPEEVPAIEEISPEDTKNDEKENHPEEEKPEPIQEEEKPEPVPAEEEKTEVAPEEEEKKPEPVPKKEKKPKPTPEKEKKPEMAPIKAEKVKSAEKRKKKKRKTIQAIVEKSIRDQSDKEFEKMLSGSMTDLKKVPKKGKSGRGHGTFGSGEGVSESDNELIMSQIYPHWAIASGVKNAESIIIEINIELRDSGEVILSSIEILDQERYKNDSTFRAAADSARRAILQASPLNIPKNKIDLLREITLRFNMKKALGR